jgi:hypothetical protein
MAKSSGFLMTKYAPMGRLKLDCSQCALERPLYWLTIFRFLFASAEKSARQFKLAANWSSLQKRQPP